MNTPIDRFACAGAIAACALLASLYGCGNAADTSGPAASTTIGTKVDDTVVTTKVRTALLSNNDIKSLDIKVGTYKGEVMLSGFADNQAQIDRSIAVAKSVDGVNEVNNKLSLKEGTQTVGNKIDDSVVTARVKSAMLSDPTMKSLDVSVTTRKGEVQLSGFVDNDGQLTHAVDVAKGIDGTSSVVNHMTIKQ